MKRLNIITGHFGSGKTEFALNMAMQSAAKTAIVDMDTVNPYYRTADAAQMLRENGIRVIFPRFANTNVDIPALPSEIFSVFQNKEETVFFDKYIEACAGHCESVTAVKEAYHRFCTQVGTLKKHGVGRYIEKIRGVEKVKKRLRGEENPIYVYQDVRLKGE